MNTSFSYQTRQHWMDQLEKEAFDICIIGGGITGAGIAWQSALSGLKVLLIEKGDFASGTSSQSSKLVHGGLRYLQQYHFGLVRIAVKERCQLLHKAPHIVTPLSFSLPIYKDSPDGVLKIHGGLYFYDLFCGTNQIAWHRLVGKKKALKAVPELAEKDLKAAVHYFDAQGDDVRLVLSTIKAAVDKGAYCINYCSADAFNVEDGQLKTVHCRDVFSDKTYTIKAKTFVNATGAWSDKTRALAEGEQEAHLRNTKGIHVIVPKKRLPLEQAVMINSKIDGRAMFAIPWEGATILGTTDDDFDADLDDVRAEKHEVAYLLDSFNGAFPEVHLVTDDIMSTMAACRPLVLKKHGLRASEVSREHDIFEGPGNLYNIIGGKLTTFMKMSKDLLKRMNFKYKEFNIQSIAKNDYLSGGTTSIEDLKTKWEKDYPVDKAILNGLIRRYGKASIAILDKLSTDKDSSIKLVEELGFIEAEIEYCVNQEMVMTLTDMLSRRLRVMLLDKQNGLTIATLVAGKMGKLLGWDKTREAAELANYKKEVEKQHHYKK